MLSKKGRRFYTFRRHSTSSRQSRTDAEICRLWQAQGTAKKIAEHLDITKSTANNVVYKNGLTRKPMRTVETVALADAPIEAWRQAVLPDLQQAAEEAGFSDAWR